MDPEDNYLRSPESLENPKGWNDIEPVLQNEGPNPVVSINYDPEYTKLMDIFRAVYRLGELSFRALDLTKEILRQNPANYTVWQYRRECLDALNVNLNSELDYLEEFAEDNPKNYQIWYHRRSIVEKMGHVEREIAFCNKIFEIDAKNYHCWAHRQWVLSTYGSIYGLWESEIPQIDIFLKADIRNNSAWNQRWFVIHRGPYPVTDAVLLAEMKYVQDKIRQVHLNESAWNYLRGLYENYPDNLGSKIKEFCMGIGKHHDTLKADGEWVSSKEEESKKPINIFAYALLADIYESENTLESMIEAAVCFEKLMIEDSIRCKAWDRRKNLLAQKLNLASANKKPAEVDPKPKV